MIGALIGDIVGSVYEFHNIKSKDFEFFDKKSTFTDDTVMTISVHNALCKYGKEKDIEAFQQALITEMRRLGSLFPDRGYGGQFRRWLFDPDKGPYGSFGNGSAMRVSPVGFYSNTLAETMKLAQASAEITHNHPEGIKGAQATATAIFLARQGLGKEQIKNFMETEFYTIDFTLDEIRETYTFDVSCQGSVPQALQGFFESKNYEDVIRNAISIGGDSDTIAAIAGGIGEAYYGVDDWMKEKAMLILKDIRGEIKGW